MTATAASFIARYHAITDDRYDGWFLPNGILEIGRVLGPEIVQNILKGCLPPITIPIHEETFERVLHDMECGNLLSARETSLEDVTELGTSVFVLSYRHLRHGTDELPRRRMNVEQRRQLLSAVTEVAAKRESTSVILWIDQAMGQRSPKDERDWVRHGILPYFAFDVLALQEQYDLGRCWIFLERMIARNTSLPETVLSDAVLYEKSYRFGTITPIQEVASAVLGGALAEKIAYDPKDKEQIRRWAAQLLEQNDTSSEKSEMQSVLHNLIGGNAWKSRQYDAEGLTRVIGNHTVPSGHVKWCDISKQNMEGRFHGLSELLGLPDKEITSVRRKEVREVIRKRKIAYVFHIFSARSGRNPVVKAVAIGNFMRSGRPSRTLLCILDGMENHERTHVLSSCILDCDEIRDAGALDFIYACPKFSEQHLSRWGKLRALEDSPLVDSARQNMETLHTELVGQLFKWTWFTRALKEAEVELDCYIESVQAGDVEWG